MFVLCSTTVGLSKKIFWFISYFDCHVRIDKFDGEMHRMNVISWKCRYKLHKISIKIQYVSITLETSLIRSKSNETLIHKSL